MVIAEEESSNPKESHDIDLKCAEKVTDSDNEETTESNDSKQSKSQMNTANLSTNTNEQSHGTHEKHFKPKAIKAQRQNIDSPLLPYQHTSYPFNSPKNPSGVLPFHPSGELSSK